MSIFEIRVYTHATPRTSISLNALADLIPCIRKFRSRGISLILRIVNIDDIIAVGVGSSGGRW
jgi:hypothetical protein